MRNLERQPQSAKPQKSFTKPVTTKTNTLANKRTTNVNQRNSKAHPPTKSNAEHKKTGNKTKSASLPENELEDPIVSYRKQLAAFQQHMENRLEKIMASDKIYKPDAVRIMKKFHTAMVEERDAMKRVVEAHGNRLQFNTLLSSGSEEANEERRKIENEFKQLDDIIKGISPSDEEKKKKSEFNKGAGVEQVKKKVIKKKTMKKSSKILADKNNQTINTTSTRPITVNYQLQTDSTRPREWKKSEGKTKEQKSETPSSFKRNEHLSKQESNSKIKGSTVSHLKNEKLIKFLKESTTDESSNSDLLLKGDTETKMKNEMKKSNETIKRNNELLNFQNLKAIEEKERKDILMNIWSEEKIRRAYTKEKKLGKKKTPIFR